MFKSFVEAFKKGWNEAKSESDFYVDIEDFTYQDVIDYMESIKNLNPEMEKYMHRGISYDITQKLSYINVLDENYRAEMEKLFASPAPANLLVLEWGVASINRQIELIENQTEITEELMDDILIKLYFRGFVGGLSDVNEDLMKLPMHVKMWTETSFLYVFSKISFFKNDLEYAMEYAMEVIGDLSYEVEEANLDENKVRRYIESGFKEIKYIDSKDTGPSGLYKIINKLIE